MDASSIFPLLHIVPDVIGHGILPDIDQRWLLVQDVTHRTRSDRLNNAIGVMRSAARFQQVAAELSLPTYPIDSRFLTTYTRQAIDADCPGPATDILGRIDADDEWLRSLNGHVIGHGDSHLTTPSRRHPMGHGGLSIQSLAPHWAWDAA